MKALFSDQINNWYLLQGSLSSRLLLALEDLRRGMHARGMDLQCLIRRLPYPPLRLLTNEPQVTANPISSSSSSAPASSVSVSAGSGSTDPSSLSSLLSAPPYSILTIVAEFEARDSTRY